MRAYFTGAVLALMLSIGCGCSMGAGPVQAAPADPGTGKAEAAKDARQAPQASKFDSIRRFGQVLDIVEQSYVKEVGQSDLIDGAIKGMLQGLDPHSSFLSAEEYKEMQETTSGEFFGIGIEFSMENGQVTVVSPIEDTPAFKAGMQTGDVILLIDGQSTQEMTMQEVVTRLRGPKNTGVDLTVLHANSKKPVKMHLIRDAIPLVSVKSRRLEDGYYWVHVTRFSEKTTEELHEALAKAEKESKPKGGLKGIVLDLRGNPGGLLKQAVSVADTFLTKGTIVSIKGRSESMARTYSASPEATDVHVPMVVLINAGSASASEIVAGALRDQKRAAIIGERSFGKGSVQNIIPLADGSALKLTIALYYTPNGSSIQAEGIVPDIEIPLAASSREDGDARYIVREQSLNRHLENKGKNKEDKDKPDEDTDVSEQLAKDNQLRLALQIVKDMPRLTAIHEN